MSCGACTLCCTLLGVVELDKPRCTKCVHEVGKCTIYHFRPESCRTFDCVWLQTQSREEKMPKSMRPDRCGVVIAADGDDLILHVDPKRPMSASHPQFKQWAREGVKMFVLTGERRAVIYLKEESL
jgi:Fe-S-cluster containining protein